MDRCSGTISIKNEAMWTCEWSLTLFPSKQYADNYFSLREALVSLFHREVDLISAKTIRNPYFRKELEATQVAVYAT